MKIPVLDQQDVTTAPLPDVPTRLDFSGVEAASEAKSRVVAQGISNLAGAAQEGYLKARAKADDAAVTDAETAFQRHINDGLYAPDTGVMHRQGENAMAGAQAFYEDLDKQRNEISQKLLTNDNQRREFARRANSLVTASTATVENHVGQQKVASDEATLRARQEQGLTAVSGDYKNPLTAAQQFGMVADSIRKLQLNKEDGDAKMAEWKSNFAATRIRSAIDAEDYGYAQQLFDATKDELGPKAERVKTEIKAVETKVLADTLAGQFVSRNTTDSGRPINGAVWAEVDKLPPGPAREAVERQVQVNLAHATAAYEQAENDRLGRVLVSTAKSGGNINESSDDYQMLSDASKAKAWEHRATLLRTDTTKQNQVDRQESARFSALPREEQAKADVNVQFPAASQTARYEMQAKQKEVRAKLASGQLEPLNEFDKQINDTAEQMGFQKPDAANLKAQMDTWYFGQQRLNNGKAPTRQEVDKELASRLQRDEGGLFGFGKQYRFQAAPGATFKPGKDQPYDKVPARAGAAPSTGETQQPAANVQAPAAPTGRPARTDPKTGVTKVWDGTKWVQGG